MDYKTILKFSSEALAVYGTGPGTAALNTAQFGVVEVKRFQATSPDFQAALYKDPTTGRYRIAIAGTNDLKGDGSADLTLARDSLPRNLGSFVSQWHPEMTDALEFAFESFRVIRDDLHRRNPDHEPTLNEIRQLVDVTGHSLGGALAELVHTFFGIGGCNIDGPGILSQTRTLEYAALQEKVSEEFPTLQRTYTTEQGEFVANAFSPVGMAGYHVGDAAFDATPNALASYLGARVFAEQSIPGAVVGVGMVGADAALHHLLRSAIIPLAEKQEGLTPANELPPVDFGALILDPHAALYASVPTSATAYGHALTWLAEQRQSNVMAGLSPNGAALDGTPLRFGNFEVHAFTDPDTGRIRELYSPLGPDGLTPDREPFMTRFNFSSSAHEETGPVRIDASRVIHSCKDARRSAQGGTVLQRRDCAR